MSKAFHEMSATEAKIEAQWIVKSSKSTDEIRRRLSEAGFNGAAAVIVSTSLTRCGMTMFMAMAMVHGPGGEVIDI